MKTQRQNGMLVSHLYSDIRHNYDSRDVISIRWPCFAPKEILWYSFFMEAEWTPGILNVGRRNKIWNQTRNLMSCGTVPQPTAPLLATRRHTQSPSMSLRRVKHQNRPSCNWATWKAVCTDHFYFYHRTEIRSYTIAHGSNASSCCGIEIWNDIFFVEADLFQHDVNSHTSYFGQQRIFTNSESGEWCQISELWSQ